MWTSVVEIRKLNIAAVSERRWTLDSHERTKSDSLDGDQLLDIDRPSGGGGLIGMGGMGI